MPALFSSCNSLQICEIRYKLVNSWRISLSSSLFGWCLMSEVWCLLSVIRELVVVSLLSLCSVFLPLYLYYNLNSLLKKHTIVLYKSIKSDEFSILYLFFLITRKLPNSENSALLYPRERA